MVRVLLLGRSDPWRRSIEDFLKVLLQQVWSCIDAAHARGAIMTRRYDLLISDWNLDSKVVEDVSPLLPDDVPVIIVTTGEETVAENHPLRKRSGGLRVVRDEDGLEKLKQTMRELVPPEKWAT